MGPGASYEIFTRRLMIGATIRQKVTSAFCYYFNRVKSWRRKSVKVKGVPTETPLGAYGACAAFRKWDLKIGLFLIMSAQHIAID